MSKKPRCLYNSDFRSFIEIELFSSEKLENDTNFS